MRGRVFPRYLVRVGPVAVCDGWRHDDPSIRIRHGEQAAAEVIAVTTHPVQGDKYPERPVVRRYRWHVDRDRLHLERPGGGICVRHIRSDGCGAAQSQRGG